ncbi:MAG: hypothetical protein GXY58_00025 [Planctomycetaceae bacterium]|nr:hypothetical protein [Planctomycetaceae bacterium]
MRQHAAGAVVTMAGVRAAWPDPGERRCKP